MGWGSGGEIFDTVAKKVDQYYEEGTIEFLPAVTILATLIDYLQQQDWDTYDESLDRFVESDVVLEAFRKADPVGFRDWEESKL